MCNTVTIQNMYTYHCHNTKQVHVSLSQCKTGTHIAVTIQNMYTYQCHSTKHIHVPLSEHKTYTRTPLTIQNIYTYQCHNTKHIHVPLSQYKTFTHTTRLPPAYNQQYVYRRFKSTVINYTAILAIGTNF